MKELKYKACAYSKCDKSFPQYNSLQKHCSYNCMNADKQNKRASKINQVSEKRKAELIVYGKLKKIFFAKPENNTCPVARRIFSKDLLATEVHHKAGRIGKLLNYVPYWLPVSRKGHEWIHENPKEAYKLGFLLPSTQANVK